MNVNHRSSSLVPHLFLRLHQPEAKYRTPFALATPFADLKVSNIRRLLLSGVLLLNLLLPSIAQAGHGRALFSLDTMAGTPFPSDLFAVADPTQNSRLRVNLPKPDCLARPSDCQDLDVINTLDGFNLQPRLSIPFDGPIDVTTVTS